MAERKPYLQVPSVKPELKEALEAAKNIKVTEEMLQEQRISFAYGNAMDNEAITKESVRATARKISLLD